MERACEECGHSTCRNEAGVPSETLLPQDQIDCLELREPSPIEAVDALFRLLTWVSSARRSTKRRLRSLFIIDAQGPGHAALVAATFPRLPSNEVWCGSGLGVSFSKLCYLVNLTGLISSTSHW